MASIRKELLTKASVDDVWGALRDIGALHTRLVPGFVIDTLLEPGQRIVTFGNGSHAISCHSYSVHFHVTTKAGNSSPCYRPRMVGYSKRRQFRPASAVRKHALDYGPLTVHELFLRVTKTFL